MWFVYYQTSHKISIIVNKCEELNIVQIKNQMIGAAILSQ